MPLYNFTVRAEDNSGAFADRDFSINVRNTITDKFIMTTGTGGAYSSVDAVTWASRPLPTGQDAVYGGGKWMIYMSGTGAGTTQQYWLSSDAINWSQYNTPDVVWAGASQFPVNFGNGKWMMMIGGLGATNNTYNTKCWVSSDGVSWTNVGSITSGLLYGRLAYGNGRWIATSGNANTCYHSVNDGVTWTTLAITGAGAVVDVIYVNGMWLATDNNGFIWTSIDGVNWAKRTLPSGTTSLFPINLTYGNGVFFAAAAGTSITNIGWYSLDGVNWTAATGGASATITATTGGVGFAAGKFVITRGTTAPMWSRDGVTWTNISGIAAGTRYSVAGISVG